MLGFLFAFLSGVGLGWLLHRAHWVGRNLRALHDDFTAWDALSDESFLNLVRQLDSCSGPRNEYETHTSTTHPTV